ncbi:MAG: LysR family transcriptional regulator [Shewanella sp.]
MEKVDVRQMRIFLHLVQEKNVSRVAEMLDISQQAVSGQLKKLREAFPSELFLRQSSGLQPTDYAYEVAGKFEKILADIDEIFVTQPFDPATSRQTFRVIANEYAQLAIIPHVIEQIRGKAPNIKIEVMDFNPELHLSVLANGDADFVIGFDNYIDQGLLRSLLQRDHYCCVARKDSKYLQQIRTVGDLSRVPHVQFSSSVGNFGFSISDFIKKNGIDASVIATLPCYTSLAAFMAVNDVVAYIPSAIARIDDFKTIDVNVSPIEFDVILGRHRRSSGNAAINWIANLVVTAIRRLSL